MELIGIEIVADRTAGSRCDSGFLRVARLELRNVYADGSRSAPYPCDIVSRPGSDAVVAVLFERSAHGGVRVLLREAPRAPVYLRRHKRFVHPDPREYLSIAEVVAGIVEEGDGAGTAGRQRRAALEAEEEAGCRVPPERFREIVETFEPGVHQFLPVTYVDRSGKTLAQRHYFVACNRLDSVDRAQTTMVLFNGARWLPAFTVMRLDASAIPPKHPAS